MIFTTLKSVVYDDHEHLKIEMIHNLRGEAYFWIPQTDGNPAKANAEINDQEYSAKKTELESLPRWMRFTYSYACNLDCYHCYQREDATQNTKLPETFLDEVIVSHDRVITRYIGVCVCFKTEGLDLYPGERGTCEYQCNDKKAKPDDPVKERLHMCVSSEGLNPMTSVNRDPY